MHQAMRLNPYPTDWNYEALGEILYLAEDYDGAVKAFNRMIYKPAWIYGYLAACHAQLGHADKAQDEAKAFKAAATVGYSVQDHITRDIPMNRDPSIKDHWFEGYRKAGLVE